MLYIKKGAEIRKSNSLSNSREIMKLSLQYDIMHM